MILQEEFYLVRHGQTDYNILEGKNKHEHREDSSLNQTGIKQAISIEPIISSLPIQTVCSSPFNRAQETKEIVASNLNSETHVIHELGECTAKIWKEIVKLGVKCSIPQEGIACEFLDRVKRGINLALSLHGPVLVVAHGGIHWALCCLMGIDKHDWLIENCIPIHFFPDPNGRWKARKLI